MRDVKSAAWCTADPRLQVRYFTEGLDVTGRVNIAALDLEVPSGAVSSTVTAKVKARQRAPDGFVDKVCVPANAPGAAPDEPAWKMKVT